MPKLEKILAVSKINLNSFLGAWCAECVQPRWFDQMNEKIGDDVVPLANQFGRVWDALMAAAPLSENNGPGAQQKRNTHSACSWFWLLRIDKFLSGHISCLSRYSHSLIQSGRPLFCVLAPARENQLQCVGIHAAAAWPQNDGRESTLLSVV